MLGLVVVALTVARLAPAGSWHALPAGAGPMVFPVGLLALSARRHIRRVNRFRAGSVEPGFVANVLLVAHVVAPAAAAIVFLG